MFVERGVAIVQFGDLRFLIGQFARVILHQLLLSAHGRKTGDVLPVALFVAREARHLIAHGTFLRFRIRDLSFQVHDLL